MSQKRQKDDSPQRSFRKRPRGEGEASSRRSPDEGQASGIQPPAQRSRGRGWWRSLAKARHPSKLPSARRPRAYHRFSFESGGFGEGWCLSADQTFLYNYDDPRLCFLTESEAGTWGSEALPSTKSVHWRFNIKVAPWRAQYFHFDEAVCKIGVGSKCPECPYYEKEYLYELSPRMAQVLAKTLNWKRDNPGAERIEATVVLECIFNRRHKILYVSHIFEEGKTTLARFHLDLREQLWPLVLVVPCERLDIPVSVEILNEWPRKWRHRNAFKKTQDAK